MNYFRELLFRPKRSDGSLLARFYFADVSLNSVASELDSFDGRRDPDRCSRLVARLRACQDRLMAIIDSMMEEIEPGQHLSDRAFRAKFPDDILTDNLSGQLWFGAECLSAGSNIVDKEPESDAMRPLASAVTKSLGKVRVLLREQCRSTQPSFTETIRENLKIFDRVFAQFEFGYVGCMVHVKTLEEYDLQQDLIVLFSATLQRALANDMITQEMVDLYEPSLMFAIPRLAIVYGLLICPEGPLNVARHRDRFPEIFLPFKNLLKKIRDLLRTLALHEVLVLEMLLCQHEEPANISVKLQEVEDELAEEEEGDDECDAEAAEATEATEHETTVGSSRFYLVLHSPETKVEEEFPENAAHVANYIIDHLVAKAVEQSPEERDSCSSPEILSLPRTASGSIRRKRRHRHQNVDRKTISPHKQRSKRARFKSTEDLLHRLYLCISGTADQLQSNYASEFRSILRIVFRANVSSPDEVEDECEDSSAKGFSALDTSMDSMDSSLVGSSAPTEHQVTLGASALPLASLPTSFSLPTTFMVDDDMMEDLRDELYLECLEDDDDDGSEVPGGAYAQNLDLHHLQEQESIVERDAARRMNQNNFFQPEPALMDIARGSSPQPGSYLDDFPTDIPPRPSEATVESEAATEAAHHPPKWVPDEQAPECMGCNAAFTIFRRRHHCRGCGLVFCKRCSGHLASLPHLGHARPVRVCNRCNAIIHFSRSSLHNRANTFFAFARNFGMVA